MKNPLKTFGPNEKGRDFVVGDLHGCIAIFENLLRHLNFDEAVDRMFSVADLVDRGPESLRTLGLLRKPWFHCVLANHEQMMYEAFNGGYMGQFWWQNGGLWGMESFNTARALEQKKNGSIDHHVMVTEDDFELFDLLCMIEELPFLITLNHKSGKKFHIIHAELPPHYVGLTDEDLADPVNVERIATIQGREGDAFVWGRSQFMPFYKADLSKRDKLLRIVKNNKAEQIYSDQLSHIISGHTIVQKPITIIGQTNIDTGAYGTGGDKKWPALTCVNLDTWEFMQATETEFRKVDPFVVNRADLENLKANS